MKKVVFRVDSGLHIGIGHLMRCITLASEFKKEDFQIYFITKNHLGSRTELIPSVFQVFTIPGELLSELNDIDKNNYDLWLGGDWKTDLLNTNRILEQITNVDLVVVDNYSLNGEYESGLKTKAVFVIDDLTNREHTCHFLLDQNLTADFIQRKRLNTRVDVTYFLGPRYALLKDTFIEFRKLAASKDSLRKVVNILVFFGGSDPNSDSIKILKASSYFKDRYNFLVILNENHRDYEEARSLSEFSPNVRLINFTENMAQEILSSDLFIGAAGSTSYERAVLGAASYVVSVADNQVLNAKILHQKRILKYLGDSKKVSDEEWIKIIDDIENNQEQINEMRILSFQLTSGEGAKIIVQNILRGMNE